MARGCYIFGVKAGRGITPWYVGQSKTGFKNECFATTKINHYHDVINVTSRGTPVLILLARYTQGNNIARTVAQDEANFIEQYMIGLALGKKFKSQKCQEYQILANIADTGCIE